MRAGGMLAFDWPAALGAAISSARALSTFVPSGVNDLLGAGVGSGGTRLGIANALGAAVLSVLGTREAAGRVLWRCCSVACVGSFMSMETPSNCSLAVGGVSDARTVAVDSGPLDCKP